MRIAFCGKMASGKTTSANYLIQYGLISTGFSRKLKEVAKDLFPEHFKNNKKPRELLQRLGIALREIDSNVWVNSLLRSLNNPIYENCTVDDCRFLNEADALRNAGFIIVKIESERNIRAKRFKDLYNEDISKFENDMTEMEIDKIKYDYLIENNSDIKYLESRLDFIVGDIMKKGGK